jgi:hypothetical protein
VVEPGAGSGGPAAEPWRASLDTLAVVVRDPQTALGRVEIVLSDHFVRYALIAWSESLVANSERLAFARLAFRDVYGQVADGMCAWTSSRRERLPSLLQWTGRSSPGCATW